MSNVVFSADNPEDMTRSKRSIIFFKYGIEIFLKREIKTIVLSPRKL
jgi:hypothetical protein